MSDDRRRKIARHLRDAARAVEDGAEIVSDDISRKTDGELEESTDELHDTVWYNYGDRLDISLEVVVEDIL